MVLNFTEHHLVYHLLKGLVTEIIEEQAYLLQVYC